ncbi:MAG: reprolysin-like metallopeptidase [Pyrinomonadaceae bacterium]
MKKTYPIFLIVVLSVGFSVSVSAQNIIWSVKNSSSDAIAKDKAVLRQSFPRDFKLFNLDIAPLRQQLFAVVDRGAQASAVILLPNADGRLEQFEVFEASNFEPELQARFPDIRAFSGRGITDRYATVKLSFSPEGIQGTVFRTASEDKQGQTEIIEPYSADRSVYAVFRSQRRKGELPFSCTTEDRRLFSSWKSQIEAPDSNEGTIRTMRLAQSCNGEYSNYFGATSAAQVGLVLAAYNGTLTRANGVYEKDLGLHLNLISESTSIIFYNPATDPYSEDLGNWNDELAGAIAAAGITSAMYDIGHMFGASGGGGNAGCIGCVCSANHDKGRGITSPSDGIPQGDNFDIDYVAHEVGHQIGANHTFSYGQLPIPEDMGQDKEVGSGITIMGYAGITEVDAADHSIDIFHETSIGQVQANLATRPCPASQTIPMTANSAPVVAAVPNYNIPILTPFALTGSATDPEGDPITYNWEQNDSAQNTGITVAAANANSAKLIGPNWLSFPSNTSPTKLFPRLSTILAGQTTTSATGTDDAVPLVVEALSSVTRDLNFRLTVRDNRPYVPGSTIGQTQFKDMTVSVTALAGPFQVTAPNTAATFAGGSSQTVTWDVANTTLAPVSAANVKISLSTDGGNTFPNVLAASTANDGTEAVTIPSIATTTGRIKVEAVGNIFFDISNADVTVTVPASIAGTVTYGNAIGAPASRPVSNVLVSASGSPNVSYITDAAGDYLLTGFGSGGYAANASKSGGQNASITSFDAARVSQYVTGVTTFTSAQLTVAEVSGNSNISSFDAALIARYAAALGSQTGSSGNWLFSPSFRVYPSVTTNVTGEDYSALLMGEVSGNWTDTGARAVSSQQSAVSNSGPERSVSVSLPRLATTDSEVVIPVGVQGAKNKGIISYEFDLRYDPSVIQPQADPVILDGTVSSGLVVVTNAIEPGLLRVVVYGPMPISDDGVLLNLMFTRVGKSGSVTSLTWERIMFNEGEPGVVVTDGRVELE